MKIRSLFISDIHLGSKHSRTKELLNFLSGFKKHSPEFIYLVGDIIDGWALKRSWYWDDNSTLVIRKLLGFVKRGTKVYFLIGNHDDFLRSFIKDYHILNFGHIYIGNEFIHTTTSEDKFLVIHGDMFDLVTKNAKWLCLLGSISYEILLNLNKWINQIRNIFGLSYWSFSKAIKHNVKQAVNHISDFEDCLIHAAVKNECSGVICGHIHTAADKMINEVRYINTGTWVEGTDYVTENMDGEISLHSFS